MKKFYIKSFITHCPGENFESCQDRICIAENKLRIAVADGVRSSFLPGLWAETISEFFVNDKTEISDFSKSVIDNLNPLIGTWERKIKELLDTFDEEDRDDYIKLKSEQGSLSASTLAGIEIQTDQVAYFSVGDSSLFFIDKENNLSAITASDELEFTSTTDSINTQNGIWGEAKSGTIMSDTQFIILMTDAISDWFNKMHQLDKTVIDTIWNLKDHDDFENFIQSIRYPSDQTDIRLKADDVSIVMIKVEDVNIAAENLTECVCTEHPDTQQNIIEIIYSDDLSFHIKQYLDNLENNSPEQIGTSQSTESNIEAQQPCGNDIDGVATVTEDVATENNIPEDGNNDIIDEFPTPKDDAVLEGAENPSPEEICTEGSTTDDGQTAVESPTEADNACQQDSDDITNDAIVTEEVATENDIPEDGNNDIIDEFPTPKDDAVLEGAENAPSEEICTEDSTTDNEQVVESPAEAGNDDKHGSENDIDAKVAEASAIDIIDADDYNIANNSHANDEDDSNAVESANIQSEDLTRNCFGDNNEQYGVENSNETDTEHQRNRVIDINDIIEPYVPQKDRTRKKRKYKKGYYSTKHSNNTKHKSLVKLLFDWIKNFSTNK